MKLVRFPGNPILTPSDNWWESRQVFNPGAAVFEDKIVLLYRAIGGDNVSRFGLATSSDGFVFKRFAEPVFEASLDNPYERLGVEDARIIKIGTEYLITYTGTSLYPATEMKAEGGWQRQAPWRVRTFLTKTTDFKTFSPEKLELDFDTKDAVLFPEKFSKGFALLHRIYPDIYLTYSYDLKSWPVGQKILEPRKGYWDSERVGAGPAPFRTERGWLHFYHGVDRFDSYCIGVLLHDLKDPTKILYRSPKPLLRPELPWEKQGSFPNVVFSAGAVEKDGEYFVYYGAADKVVGVATIAKKKLLSSLRFKG